MSGKTQLEKDFDEVKDAVNAKLKEAAAAVREAQALAKTKGLSLMRDGDDYRVTPYLDDGGLDLELSFNVNQLVNAMDSAGWNSSSWDC